MLRREALRLATALALLLPTGRTAAQGAPDAAGAAEEGTREIVVTGSRIRREDPTTPAPVTVIGRDQIVASGKVSIGDFLQSLPEQGNAINTSVNYGGDGSTRVSLRSLGTTRTLVLVNGRRVVAGGTGADAAVDLNSIPSAAIESVEILKDGASAVYGSGAVAGVVNLITRKRFDGSDVSAFYGTSSRGDAQITDLAWTSGMASEQGSLLFTVGYYDQKESWAGDRDFSKNDKYYDFTDGTVNPLGSSANPNGFFQTPSGFLSASRCAAATPGSPLAEACAAFDASGSRNFTFDQATQSYVNYVASQHEYNYQLENYLVTPSKRVSVFATGDTTLANVGRGYFEASYVNRRSEQRDSPVPLAVAGLGSVSADSIYNPFGVDLVAVRRRLVEAGPRREDQDLDTFRLVAGVDGRLGDWAGPLQGWTWDLFYGFGRTQGVDTKHGALRTNLLGPALGPSMDPDGSLSAPTPTVSGDEICVATPGDASTAIPGCVPLNILWAYGLPADGAAIRALAFTGPNRGYDQLKALNANVTGELFPILAEEPVSLAIGAEYREEAGGDIVNPVSEAGLGSDYNKQTTEGRFFAREAYAELHVPIVANMRGAAKVGLDAAARYTSYNTFGDTTSFEVGGTWAPVSDVTIRGTYSTAFRAPTIGDLFAGTRESFPVVSDPCSAPAAGSVIEAQCIADGVPAGGNGDANVHLRADSGGNVNLQPEKARIFTIGAVLRPRQLPDFSATLDYYRVAVDDTISSIGASVILSSCYSGVPGQRAYCDKIQRQAGTALIDFIDDRPTNVGSTEVSGIDLSLRYQLPTSYGRFGFAFDGTYLLEYEDVLPDGTIIEAAGNYDLGLVLPRVKFVTGVNWERRGFGAGLSARFLGPHEECGASNGTSFGGVCAFDDTWKRKVETYVTFDGFASYTLDSGLGSTTFTLGMLNALDREPAAIYSGLVPASDPTAYDFTMRYVYFRLRQRF